jgi:hypothetical protein
MEENASRTCNGFATVVSKKAKPKNAPNAKPLGFGPGSTKDAGMKAFTIAGIGVALTLWAVPASADEAPWRAVPKQGAVAAPVAAPVSDPPAEKAAETPAAPAAPVTKPAETDATPALIRFEDSEMLRQEAKVPASANEISKNDKPLLPSYGPITPPRMLPDPKLLSTLPQGVALSAPTVMPTYELVDEHPLTSDICPSNGDRQWYFSAEALLWWIKGFNTPPLLTTATPPNTGFIGGPTTQILLGNGPVLDPFGPGGRFTAGTWLDCEQEWALEASFFFLGPRSTIISFDSSQFPVLIRPFFAINPQINAEFGEIVAFPPGFTIGGVPIPSSSGSFTTTATSLLLGPEVNLKRGWCFPRCDGSSLRIEPFVGARFLDLSEALTMVEQITVIANNPNPFDIPGTRVTVTDAFATQNQFYGGQVGTNVELRNGRWFADLRGSIALGMTHESLEITGSQVHTQPGGATMTFAGGLLALPGANIGQFSQNHLSFVPEGRLDVGYQITPNWRAFIGYDFLYWYSVIRPGSEIDRVLDLTHAPNPPPGLTPVFPTRPMPLFSQVDFFAQGVSVGVQLRW